jgi:hypothetical protein
VESVHAHTEEEEGMEETEWEEMGVTCGNERA